MGESGKSVEKPTLEAVTGEKADRIKRESLGIGDRRKHHKRAATPLKGHVKESDKQHRLYRFRFYPTAEQAEQLAKTFGACRWVYNEGLALRTGAWERHRVNVGFAESCRALTGWKRVEGTAWLGEVSSTVLQQSLRHLDQAFGRFFKGSGRHPQRKRKGRSQDSATYVRTGFRWVEDAERPGTGLITLAKQSAPLDVRWSRALPVGVVPVRLSVTRDRAGRYFVSTLVEERIVPLPAVFVPGSRAPKAVGLDLGLASLVALDDGTKVGHPRLLRRYAEKLARLQRELHKKVRGSANRDKVRRKIARLYALISDVRKDMLDQFTTRLVRENQVLVVEDLAIGNLMRPARGTGRRRKAKLNEAIIDAGWGELLRQLRYKCAWYGRTLVVVDRFFPSTRRCSACHTKGPKLDVSVREWTCAGCGVVHDRDVNAAVNLRDEGLRLYWLVAAGLPPAKGVPTLIRASELEDCLRAA
ncbi:RNA-guided endonuclease InsQ/TnpB family protein [Streptomyces sp. WI04-05B]|uniref:RNA-guided endonuclease InsQ/TnpB family protein n=1 Tax=Streptomyces TaxID=1883 RepID=UPI0029B67B5C|nr:MULTISPECIES: RNA-guided endonuclease TnpB family protein [unclassified Streptomyces]MDX2544918.1 RNA-guided endonuclease TnpB family protein [Streptomyces sp. WI04-05B]MDX2588966.1 RNA-guided endonuclease TnpB family protein [Streptomyces sp. WI04-05A]MDX3750818.1 RNA-guided endonuclease TnpB family protein [Streptomyces sp. AK08-02]